MKSFFVVENVDDDVSSVDSIFEKSYKKNQNIQTFVFLEVSKMIHSVMIFNRQGRTRLEKWYTATSQKQKSKVVRNLTEMIPRRPSRFSNIIEMSDIKVVYKDRGSRIVCGHLQYESLYRNVYNPDISDMLHYFSFW